MSTRLRMLCLGLCVSLWPTRAGAMHITEGILSLPWAGLWLVVAGCGVFAGLRTIRARQAADPKYITLVSLIGAAVFVISCMPIPIPWVGTCAHPCGTGLAAILIGPGPTTVVAGIALLLQTMLLGHGGYSTWGANVVSMGLVGSVAAWGTFHVMRRLHFPLLAAVFAAGVVSDWATYATTAAQLAAALHGNGSFIHLFFAISIAFMPTQIPLGILEGFMTAGACRFMLARRPEMFRWPGAAAAAEECA